MNGTGAVAADEVLLVAARVSLDDALSDEVDPAVAAGAGAGVAGDIVLTVLEAELSDTVDDVAAMELLTPALVVLLLLLLLLVEVVDPAEELVTPADEVVAAAVVVVVDDALAEPASIDADVVEAAVDAAVAESVLASTGGFFLGCPQSISTSSAAFTLGSHMSPTP